MGFFSRRKDPVKRPEVKPDTFAEKCSVIDFEHLSSMTAAEFGKTRYQEVGAMLWVLIQEIAALKSEIKAIREDKITTPTNYNGERARLFHFHNPDVWKMFCEFTNGAISCGLKVYSAKEIFERIQLEIDEGDAAGRATFKVNKDFAQHYARWYIDQFPEYEGFFTT